VHGLVPGGIGFAVVEEGAEFGVGLKLRALSVQGFDAAVPRGAQQSNALGIETLTEAHGLDSGAQYVANRRKPPGVYLRFSEAGNVFGYRRRWF